MVLLLFRSLSYKKDETKSGAKKIFQRDQRPWTAMVGFYNHWAKEELPGGWAESKGKLSRLAGNQESRRSRTFHVTHLTPLLSRSQMVCLLTGRLCLCYLTEIHIVKRVLHTF